MLVITTVITEPSALEESRVEAILASLRFEDTPIDTSASPTYEDETFSMSYPPSWLVDENTPFPPNVRFLNKGAQDVEASREMGAAPDLLIENRASIYVGGDLSMRHGVDVFVGNCSRTVIETTFAGQPATKFGNGYWVELPSGGAIKVIGSATQDAEPRTRQLLDAALATITFRE